MTEHSFTTRIKSILTKHLNGEAENAFNENLLIQYLNFKTKSANKDVKARSSFANLYAIYVLVEDYVTHNFHLKKREYANYEGASYTKLLERQRNLPFGSKLQNHALNNRMNSEFKKFFPLVEIAPILRNLETNRYWINENFIIYKEHNLANAILEIIESYIELKQKAFELFISTCEELQLLNSFDLEKIKYFILNLLAPTTDARLFEIVSYAILKHYYKNQQVYFGFELSSINKENLKLYKTGRTNANDGGIDFVMKPLGRFFQVTETLDIKKYFLDIDKIEKYPLTFVIKSEKTESEIFEKIKANAIEIYPVKSIVEKYLACIEEIITLPKLIIFYEEIVNNNHINDVLNEIISQSKLEFNYEIYSN